MWHNNDKVYVELFIFIPSFFLSFPKFSIAAFARVAAFAIILIEKCSLVKRLILMFRVLLNCDNAAQWKNIADFDLRYDRSDINESL